jgi:hypothetical protein
MNHFDIIESVRTNKKYILTNENEHEYDSFMVNRGLSYFRDTLAQANQMNISPSLDVRMQYDYYFHRIRKTASSRAKWSKKIKQSEYPENLKNVVEYYGYSYQKATEALKTLNNQQLDYIKSKLFKGE